MPSQETTNALAEQRLVTLETKVDQLANDRDQALKWGIITLGTAVIGLALWIFNFVLGHYK